ncbi:hypothetical protein HU200_035519 [Digitaria exilis]|uniref:KIB1-4 beta-propeller domain-containing protein n=1 Tax=Digitaria exilis TaxID=1010633 RepID=A0A835BRR2_9POAL|nr:hypothetical protein HU200_035519 [Digitaria exilis]
MTYERGHTRIVAVTFHGGKAYYMDQLKNIIICDLDTATHLPPKCTRIFNVVHVANELCTCDRFHPVGSVHLVSCNGDLLLVVLRSRGSGHPSWAEVYKPEWTCETDPFSRVVLRERVVELGEYSLFLSARGHTFALSAKEFPAIKRNCVYYAGRLDYNCCISYWITVFSLDSGGVLKEIPYLNKLKQGEARWTPYAWRRLRSSSQAPSAAEANPAFNAIPIRNATSNRPSSVGVGAAPNFSDRAGGERRGARVPGAAPGVRAQQHARTPWAPTSSGNPCLPSGSVSARNAWKDTSGDRYMDAPPSSISERVGEHEHLPQPRERVDAELVGVAAGGAVAHSLSEWPERAESGLLP